LMTALSVKIMADLGETDDPYNPQTGENVHAAGILPNAAHNGQPQTLKRRIYRTLLSQYFQVFAGLLILFILLWTFCIIAAVRPIYITNWTSQYLVWSRPKTVNYITTPIATLFAIITTYYFIRCVRFAMRRYLTRVLETRAFLGWSAVANKRVFLREFSWWTTFTLLSAVILAALTTGFTATFTPQQTIRVIPQKRFEELDMSSSAFLNVYTQMSPSLPCRYGDYTFFSCSKSGQRRPLMLLEAGESAALIQLGYVATTNFAKTAFADISCGVMPLGNYSFSIWFADSSSRPNYGADLPGYNSNFTSFNASYQQQGLTATVTCTTEQSSPLDFTIAQSFPNLNSSIITPTVTCSNSTSPLPQQVVGADFLLASSCSLANQTQYIHLRGYGAYAVNTVDNTSLIANMTCQLDPLFTTNIVTFAGDLGQLVFVSTVPNTSVPALTNSNTTLITDITATITQNLLDGQSQNGNAFVDFIQGLVDAYPGQVSPNSTAASMIQGMFEISGLSFNGYWSSKLFANSSASGPFTRSVSGNLTYNVYVWNGDAKAIAGLIPFTVVVVIAFLLLGWGYFGSSSLDYHPSEPLSLVVASGAGDFDWLSDVDIEVDDLAHLSTGFVYKKVDGRWTLAPLLQSPVGKEG